MNVQELLAEVATPPVVKRAITNHEALNEAYAYGSSFSRGMRIDLNGLSPYKWGALTCGDWALRAPRASRVWWRSCGRNWNLRWR